MLLNKNTAVLSAIGAMISVQSGSSIAKYLFPLIGPAGAVVLRVGIAGILRVQQVVVKHGEELLEDYPSAELGEAVAVGAG